MKRAICSMFVVAFASSVWLLAQVKQFGRI